MSLASAVTIERVVGVRGTGEDLESLAYRAAERACEGRTCGAVLAATFSHANRFPALSVRVAGHLKLPAGTPGFDLQMACSAYPYALYLAGKLAADLAAPVLVIDGDVQSPLVDAADKATGRIFSDAVTATLVSSAGSAEPFAFLSRPDDALSCSATGPIHMDGFKVFTFVATEVSQFLRQFPSESFDDFVPHQANPYMVRQLARSLGWADRLRVFDPAWLNPGSCSVALTLAAHAESLRGRRALVAGFGAGYSAAAGIVHLAPDFSAFVSPAAPSRNP